MRVELGRAETSRRGRTRERKARHKRERGGTSGWRPQHGGGRGTETDEGDEADGEDGMDGMNQSDEADEREREMREREM